MTKSTICVLGAALLLFSASNSMAFDAAQKAKLLDLKSCEKCDLSNADLKKADLSRAEIDYINLRGIDLGKAILKGAIVKGADFLRIGEVKCSFLKESGAIIDETTKCW